eukprot:c17358_g1_i1 orf=181-981(-)
MQSVAFLCKRFFPLPKPVCSCWALSSWQRAMGGGPRTFPGGVTKWQWKRMMVKKREEREQRQLAREKELYKMRQRAEVLATHPELQQPWEKLATFPPPGITAGQQLSGLVSRFERPTEAEDLWSQRDGPQQNPHEHVAGAVDADTMMGIIGSANHRDLSLKAHMDESMANRGIALNKDQSPTMRSHSLAARRHVVNVNMPKKKKDVSAIGKSMQDYLDSFETDPLGLAVDSVTSTSPKERQRDPLGLAVERKTSVQKKGVRKHKVR